MRLKDKVALITGASDEFARAIALGFAGEGASLYLHDFDDRADGLATTLAAVKDTGQKVASGLFDITHAEPTQAMTRPAMGPRCSSKVMISAISWHGWVAPVRPLITGTSENRANSSNVACSCVRSRMAST